MVCRLSARVTKNILENNMDDHTHPEPSFFTVLTTLFSYGLMMFFGYLRDLSRSLWTSLWSSGPATPPPAPRVYHFCKV